RGISKFYDGKSKSYGSLADAAKVSSIQDIVKKEDAYSRKRKNMIAHTVLLEELRNSSSERDEKDIKRAVVLPYGDMEGDMVVVKIGGDDVGEMVEGDVELK
ncbi:hypothetical protein Tco_1478681, partial [Tanacetum coccineum]